ncbi:hypothetical protein F5148DRAFT_1285405 [Russula earlei]|uniref:Uncharacterized protein n=1 Tax=Russula earlei TaxID=71964 RepID=A0ACC0U6J9_9AGAM|nr:hypothetical protein F5148DRAFT_1285405 [Russula earlei]
MSAYLISKVVNKCTLSSDDADHPSSANLAVQPTYTPLAKKAQKSSVPQKSSVSHGIIDVACVDLDTKVLDIKEGMMIAGGIAMPIPRRLERMSTFYGDSGGAHACHLVTEPVKTETTGDNSNPEPETDWLEDLESTQQPSTKRSEAMVIERPSWSASVAPPGPSASDGAPPGSQTWTTDDVPSSRDCQSSATALASEFCWPTDTDLILTPDSNKVTLSKQCPLICLVLQDAVDSVQASLLIDHAFPDAPTVLTVIKAALLSAASSHPSSSFIHWHLQSNHEYVTKIIPVVRSSTRDGITDGINSRVVVSPFSNVKPKNATLPSSLAELLAIPSVEIIIDLGDLASIIAIVEKQLTDYNYMFPTSKSVSLNFGLIMCSRPYWNMWIINVIHNLYFARGVNLFVSKFGHRFPTHQDTLGVMTHEVPIPMVTLVATVLYAALHEWHTGVHQATDFSANAYLDVYCGHIGTFNHIQEHCGNAFHMMMADIFTKAHSTSVLRTSVPIAGLNLEELNN